MAEEYNKALEKFITLANDEKNWVSLPAKHGVKISLQHSSSCTILRSKGSLQFDATVAEIEEFFSGDFAQWSKVVERKLKSATVLGSQGDYQALHTKLNLSSFLPTANDVDFVSVASFRKLNGSTPGVFFHMTNDALLSQIGAKAPTSTDSKRVKLGESGYVWKRQGENGPVTLISILTLEHGTWMPAWLEHIIAATQALNVHRIRNVFDTKKGKKVEEEREELKYVAPPRTASTTPAATTTSTKAASNTNNKSGNSTTAKQQDTKKAQTTTTTPPQQSTPTKAANTTTPQQSPKTTTTSTPQQQQPKPAGSAPTPSTTTKDTPMTEANEDDDEEEESSSSTTSTPNSTPKPAGSGNSNNKNQKKKQKKKKNLSSTLGSHPTNSPKNNQQQPQKKPAHPPSTTDMADVD